MSILCVGDRCLRNCFYFLLFVSPFSCSMLFLKNVWCTFLIWRTTPETIVNELNSKSLFWSTRNNANNKTRTQNSSFIFIYILFCQINRPILKSFNFLNVLNRAQTTKTYFEMFKYTKMEQHWVRFNEPSYHKPKKKNKMKNMKERKKLNNTTKRETKETKLKTRPYRLPVKKWLCCDERWKGK